MQNAFVKFGHKGILMPFLPAPATYWPAPAAVRRRVYLFLTVQYAVALIPYDCRLPRIGHVALVRGPVERDLRWAYKLSTGVNTKAVDKPFSRSPPHAAS